MALLETEREAFLRELMVIKERVDAAKDGYVSHGLYARSRLTLLIDNLLIWKS